MIEIDEKNLKQGVLGLVLALVEIIEDTLRIQAVRRMDSGLLTDDEIERLGSALLDLKCAIEEIKEEQGITETVKEIREELDDVVNDVVDMIGNPERWKEQQVPCS
ncbi:MAG: gas vesicle protein K [Methanoregula sp.]|nr:gas vesicle protein K [Methanoregula sp.]